MESPKRSPLKKEADTTMMVSTKGRYALLVMMALAENAGDGYMPLSEIARQQKISEKYLECIVALLNKEGLVDALRGKGGGYRLNRPPESYTVAEIVRATEQSYAPVTCLQGETNDCECLDDCKTIRMWEELYRRIDEYLSSVTVADLIKGAI